MGEIVEYEHHGVVVKVDSELKGKHREHCLCYRCERFAPSPHSASSGCVIADANYAMCVKYGVTTPVYECPVFVAKAEQGGRGR